MTVIIGNPTSVGTRGWFTDISVRAGWTGPDIMVSALTQNSVTFTITKVPATTTSIKIGYRVLKYRNTDALTYSAEKSNPVVGDTIQITGLTEDTPYEIFPFAYDSTGYQSEPGGILRVIPSRGYTHMRDICESLKNLFVGSSIASGPLNVELAELGTRDGKSYLPYMTITDAKLGAETEWPYCAIIAQESPVVEKWGNRKQWQYIIQIEVGIISADGDPQELQRWIEAYLESVETLIDENDTIGSTVWEAEVKSKVYSQILELDGGVLARQGLLTIIVDQTN